MFVGEDHILTKIQASEKENIKILGEYANLSEKEKIEIKSLKEGNV